MDETTCDPTKFDVESEYTRLIKNVQELYNKNLISPNAARKSAEKIRHWRKVNLCHQLGTNT